MDNHKSRTYRYQKEIKKIKEAEHNIEILKNEIENLYNKYQQYSQLSKKTEQLEETKEGLEEILDTINHIIFMYGDFEFPEEKNG